MPFRARTLFRIFLFLAALAAGLIALTRFALEPWVARSAASDLSRRLGVPVEVGSASVRLPATLILDDVQSERGTAKRITLVLDPRALLRRQRVVLRGSAEYAIVPGWGRVALADFSRTPRNSGAGGPLLTLHDAHAEQFSAHAETISIAFDEHQAPREIAVYGGKLFALEGIEASLTVDGDRVLGHIDSRGVSGSIRYVRNGTLEADLRFEDAPLAGPSVAHFDLGHARLDGSLHVEGSLLDAIVDGDLAVRHLGVFHPSLASRPLADLDGAITGRARIRDGGRRIDSDRLTLGRSGVAVTLFGSIDADGTSNLTLDLPRTPCDGLLVALAPLVPTLDGLALRGEATARATFRADASRLQDLVLGLDFDIGCTVERDAFLADPTLLDQPLLVRLDGGEVRLLGPAVAGVAGATTTGKSSFIPLEALPSAVIGSFLAAEDARFFDHAGFDPYMIRRALAFDLASHAFIKGASSITQQLARNLFLDGDRTISRKLEEAVLAWRLEQVVEKRRMLELYLNVIQVAPGVFGVAEGARHFFDREAGTLDLDEAARLAALAPAPHRGFDEFWLRRYRDLLDKLRAGEGLRQAGALRARHDGNAPSR